MFLINRKRKFQQLEDIELIQLYISEGCEFTIPLLYERYAHLVMGSCLKYLRQTENAEDVTMRIFEELGNKLNRYEIQHFKSWLFQVTRNECLQFLRKNKPGDSVMITELSTPAEDLCDEKVELENKLQLLEKAIEELKQEQQICVRMFYLDQKSYNEISDELNISLNTVKSAIQNGKRNLKLWIERNEGHEA